MLLTKKNSQVILWWSCSKGDYSVSFSIRISSKEPKEPKIMFVCGMSDAKISSDKLLLLFWCALYRVPFSKIMAIYRRWGRRNCEVALHYGVPANGFCRSPAISTFLAWYGCLQKHPSGCSCVGFWPQRKMRPTVHGLNTCTICRSSTWLTVEEHDPSLKSNF